MQTPFPLNEEELAGRCLIVGLPGEKLGKPEARILSDLGPAGVILFNRNLRERSQACDLINALQEQPSLRFIALDQEGGRVDRLRGIFPPFPAVDAPGLQRGGAAAFRSYGSWTGRVMRAFGCNVNFAPVLDLRCSDADNALPGRYLGSDPRQVSALGAQYVDGLLEAGVAGCGKHFPGLGRAVLDSHKELPVIETEAEDLLNEDILPFRYLCSRLPMMMVAHAAYPGLVDAYGDDEDKLVPASSLPMTYRLLRSMRFKGMTVTDDLDMGAIAQACPAEELPTKLFRAGADLLLIGANIDFARLCRDSLARLVREPFWKEEAVCRCAKQDRLPALQKAAARNIKEVEEGFVGWKAELGLD